MSAMLEKAARAVGEVAATMDNDVRHVLSERAIEDIARAVLLAIREPTEEIENAIGRPYYIDGQFTAMIDAILTTDAKETE